ncbi:MAG TPA: aldehyde dehydrogenase (NADP(+)) [Bryobacteraceae bacterium]|nr:aldehyde dehydrogenase (NADP(+)) [Bryobacteraceae bacterium]
MSVHEASMTTGELAKAEATTFRGFDPRQGEPTNSSFREASAAEIAQVAGAAAKAFEVIRSLGAKDIAALLDTIREEILALGETLAVKADEETALGKERLNSERDRTVNQIKLFADLLREGSWVDARIDTAQPERKPVPKPDLRRMLEPIGPVAVFGASNFPLAFSVAGGDTASALAAGNPVIVKAHPAHPGTSEMVAAAIRRAVEARGLPSGTFSMIHGIDPSVSLALVMQPEVKAVAFTGSQRAGRALFDAAAKRPEPIPVFAEMGSVNPVFLLPSAVAQKAEGTAEGLYRSVTLGVGQFCTSPGLVFVKEGQGLSSFLSHLRNHFEQAVPGTMLNRSIAKAFAQGFENAAQLPDVECQVAVRESDPQKTEGRPGLLVIQAQNWLKQEQLRHEIFGPATIVVRCQSDGETVECAKALEGTLTATIHGTPAEILAHQQLIDVLRCKAGRLLFNGFPTGVEVGYAMQHGGPYPASTDARFTSVGAASIYRFARPICYQNFPQDHLPEELQNANPRNIWRMVNGMLTKDAVPAV